MDLLRMPGIRSADAAVSRRSGGVSAGPYQSLNLSMSVGDDPAAVLENRRRLATAFGAAAGDFVFARQVHGTGVAVVDAADRGRGAYALDDAIPDCDALVTVTPGVVLAILTADCAPIVLHDPVAGVLGCVHSGWRGTAAGVAGVAVAAMAGLGAAPARVVASVGPVIDPARYQVGADVRDAFGGRFTTPDGRTPGRWLLDLRAANRQVLRDAGLIEQNIHVTDSVTGTAPDSATGSGFFSDRAQRPCGRLALVARLRTAP